MHEVTLAGHVLRAALVKGGGDATPMRRLVVRIGELETVSEESLRKAFYDQAQGTAAGSAELVVESVPATIVCERCGHTALVRETPDAGSCVRCGGDRLHVDGRGWTVSVVRGPS